MPRSSSRSASEVYPLTTRKEVDRLDLRPSTEYAFWAKFNADGRTFTVVTDLSAILQIRDSRSGEEVWEPGSETY